MTKYDAVVIGGGPAGLQATLTLARVHRNVVMLDSGSYRNDPAHQMHNVATHDGTPPADYRAAARKELAAYPTVTVRKVSVASVRPTDDGLVVDLGDEELLTGGVVLATGLRDALPAVPGVAELFGTVVAHCPFCHGHEFADQPSASSGVAGAGHLPGIMRPVASRITVFTNGEELLTDLASDIAVRTEQVVGVRPNEGGATVNFADGPDEQVAGLFVTPSFSQRAPFAEQLGLAMRPSGCIEIDVMGRTSRPGVYAAGDLAHVAALPMPMASVLTAAAAGQAAAAALIADSLSG